MVKTILDGTLPVGLRDKYHIGKHKVFIAFNDKSMIKIKWKSRFTIRSVDWSEYRTLFFNIKSNHLWMLWNHLLLGGQCPCVANKMFLVLGDVLLLIASLG